MQPHEAMALALSKIDEAFDQGRLGKHLDSVEEIKAAPADDLISRLAILAEIDRRIALWTGMLDPKSAWHQGDIAKIATLVQLKVFVAEMEAS